MRQGDRLTCKKGEGSPTSPRGSIADRHGATAGNAMGEAGSSGGVEVAGCQWHIGRVTHHDVAG